jgi:hypothetical protein
MIRKLLTLLILWAGTLSGLSLLMGTTNWSAWNGITVGGSTSNISHWNAGTIGTTSGNIGAWNGLTSPSASSPVSVDNSLNMANSSSGTTISGTFTISASATELLASFTAQNGHTPTRVCAGGTGASGCPSGVAMTQLACKSDGNGAANLCVYHLDSGIPSGSVQITATYTTEFLTGNAVSFLNSTGSLGTPASQSGTKTSNPSDSVSSATNKLAFQALAVNLSGGTCSTFTIGLGTGQTQVPTTQACFTAQNLTIGSTKAGATTVTQSETGLQQSTTVYWAAVYVSVN